MRSIVRLALVIGFLAVGCQRVTPERFPNAPIILVSIDTLRADHLSAYGAKLVRTPAIDRLAADGIIFENAYAHVPLTFPSHVTMLTGALPYENGVRSNVGYTLDPRAHPTLPRLLAEKGYATGASVSAYVLRGETGLGAQFDFYDDAMGVRESETLGELQRRGDETVRAALHWLDSVQNKPFFLFLHLFEPHSPYEPVEPFRSQYASPYDGEIATVDAILGRFLADLDRRGLYGKTLIILAGDHGEGLGDHGEAEHGVLLYREALHVPLIVKLPGRALRHSRVAAPAQLVDILPTVAKAVGARVPTGLAGMSLIDLARGKTAGDRKIYSETLYPRLHLGWSQLRSLTDARDHYIESPEPEMYDIVTDPRETRNIRAERRRDANALAGSLATVPLNLRQPGNVSSEERARLAALGYLSGAPAPASGPLRNPRDHLDVLTRIERALALNQQGRYSESAAVCREILRDDPDLVDVYTQLAGNLRHLGRTDEALEAYREAVRRSPQLVDSLAIEIAKLQLDRGDLRSAELNAQQAMRATPLEAHLVLAAVAESRSDLTAAEREARLALGSEEHPRVPALLLLARLLAQQQKLNEALAMSDRARKGAHPVPTVASMRGDILARMGRNREAESEFREEMARFPATTEAYAKLALLLAAEHRFSEIEPTLEAMVKASPKPSTYFLAAREMKDLGNEAGARTFRTRGERLAADLQRKRRQ